MSASAMGQLLGKDGASESVKKDNFNGATNQAQQLDHTRPISQY